MVSATLGNLLGDEVRRGVERLKNYSIEEIEEIINNGTMEDKRVLSRTFFKRDGFYKKIILHYAYLFKYAGLLIPNTSFGNSITDSAVKKRYKQSIDYIEEIRTQKLFGEISV